MTITPTDTASVSVTGLPNLGVTPVWTPHFEMGQATARLAYNLGSIVTFDGPAGCGKTTTAVAAVRELPLKFVYVKLRHKAGTKEVLQAIFQALHPGQQLSGRVREADYNDACIDILTSGSFGVVADEVHYTGTSGLIMLSQLWESVRCDQGRGFPMLLVGADVNAAASAAPELETRIRGKANFRPLANADLISVLSSLDDRCAATNPKLLAKVDAVYGRGLLRRWETFIQILNLNPDNAGTAISPDEIRGFLLTQGIQLSGRAA